VLVPVLATVSVNETVVNACARATYIF